ncbi:MAG: methyltransferase family protein [Ignavibacteriales bacterium]
MNKHLFQNLNQFDLLFFIANLIVGLCVAALFISILINFIESKQNGKAAKEKKSIVETGTMTLFFLAFYTLIRFDIWGLSFNNNPLRIFIVFFGLFMVILGCIINIRGRFNLGRNWANHIKIYEKQTLVREGVYRVVRHPLYASIIWMFYGASLIYLNLSAFLANTLIFIPFMYYRAKQEEELLTNRFEEYKEYQTKVGMFFPNLF